MNLYNVLSKRYVGMSNFERLFAQKFGGTGGEIKELKGGPPLTFTANGQPLLDYRIYGNTVQTGTPTPENPIVPSGCGERTENLFDVATAYGAMCSGGVITGQAGIINDIKNKVTADMIGKTHTISITPLQIASRAYMSRTINGTTYWRENELNVNQRSSFQFTPVTENDQWYITYDISGICSYKDIMVNEGSTPLPYEPYGYKLPLTSAGQNVDIYLGEVETTRRIGKIDLGTMNWDKTASGNFLATTAIPNIRTIANSSKGNAICDMFKEVTPNAVANEPYSFSSCLNFVGKPFINKTGFEDLTAEKFKQAMSGVYMYYVLAEPETRIVNEPLMKIGDYADTVSMEQAGVIIPTNKGSTTLDVDTTIKPSNVYIKYHT